MTLPLTIPHAGGAACLQEFASKVGLRFDVTFADETCEVTESQNTNITDELH